MPSDQFAPAARPRQHRRRFTSLRAVTALVLREMSTSYGRSPGGYIWAIVEPAASVALLTLVFSAIMRTPPMGINFAIFYATGVVPFLMFNGIHSKVSGGLTYSRALLAYPTVTYLDSLLARFLLEIITKLLVSYIVFTFILLAFETRVSLDFPTIIKAYMLVMIIGFGVGCLNCFLFARAPAWQRAWGILTTPLLIISGVFFTYEQIPQQFQGYLWYNPLIHITGLMRTGFYPTYRPDYISEVYVVGVSLVCMALGLLLLRRYHQDLLSNA